MDICARHASIAATLHHSGDVITSNALCRVRNQFAFVVRKQVGHLFETGQPFLYKIEVTFSDQVEAVRRAAALRRFVVEHFVICVCICERMARLTVIQVEFEEGEGGIGG